MPDDFDEERTTGVTDIVEEFEKTQKERKRRFRASQSELEIIFNRVSMRPPPIPTNQDENT